MPSTGKSKPKLLNIPQLTGIHITHPEIGKAFEQLIDYINKNLHPIQGNRVEPK